MLQQLFYVTIITATFLLWGLPLYLLASRYQSFLDFWAPTVLSKLCLLFFSGLVTVSVLTNWAVLVLPADHRLLTGLIIAGGALAARNKKQVAELLRMWRFGPATYRHRIALGFLLCGGVTLLLLGILQPVHPDTNIYHVQIVRWTNEYGTVPGVANLFARYGLNSAWFNLVALFKMPFFGMANYTWLNTTVALWFLLWLCDKWLQDRPDPAGNGTRNTLRPFYLLVMVYCFFEWEIIRDAANSANYDFIVFALMFIVLSGMLQSLLEHRKETVGDLILYLIAACSLITFKLSGMFLLGAVLVSLLRIRKRTGWFLAMLTSALILPPLLIKNYITSGYPLFPLSFAPLAPDWQVPQGITDHLRQYIYVSNRLYNQRFSMAAVPELMHLPWLALWFKGLLLQQKIVVSLALASPLCLLAPIGPRDLRKKMILLFAAIASMFIGWMLTAPSPRFAYGFLLIMAFIPVSLLLRSKITEPVQSGILLLLCGSLIFYAARKTALLHGDATYLLHTMQIKESRSERIDLNGHEFRLPYLFPDSWKRDCRDNLLPCIFQRNPYLQYRGDEPGQGFRMRPLPDSVFIRNYIY